MSLKQKVIKETAWTAGLQWGEQVIGFSVFSVLARLLGPEDFGVVALAAVFINLLKIFNNQGISEAVVQRDEIEEEHLNVAFWLNLTVSFILCISTIAIAGKVSEFYHEPQLTPVLRWLSVSFIIFAFNSIQGSILRRKLEFKLLAIRSFVGVLSGAIVGILMALTGYGVWSLVGQRLTNITVGVLLLWLGSDWRPGFKVSLKHLKELLPFSISVTGLNVFSFINNNADSLLIGYFLGSRVLGYYNVAYRIIEILTTLIGGVAGKVGLPIFSKLQNNSGKLREAFYEILATLCLLIFPIFLGVASLAPELITVLFGEKWEASIQLLQILCFLGILNSVTWVHSAVILGLGKASKRLSILFVTTTLSTIVFAFTLPSGIEKATLAFVITNFLSFPILVIATKKLIGLNIRAYLSILLTPILCTLVMTASVYLNKAIVIYYLQVNNQWIIIFSSSFIAAFVYIAFMFLVFRERARQLLSLAKMLKKKSKQA